VRQHSRMAFALALGAAVTACASTQKPATLSQAESIYQTLSAQGAEERVRGEMIEARAAIGESQAAVARKRNQEYVDGLSYIALRAAQTAEAEHQRLLAASQADSLQKARLSRLLTLSEAQRAALSQQQQLSEAEIAALRERNMLVSAQADSLRLAAEAAEAKLNQALMQLQTLVAEITNIRETTRGLVVSLSDVLFDVNQATLKAGAEQNIRRISAILNQYPDYQISVEGHTDATGTDAYNQDLSTRRAAAVREALVQGGVPAGRIASVGYGESQPVATNDTPAGRQQNRRVEVIVLGAGTVADVEQGGAGAAQRDTTQSQQPPR